MILNSEHGSIRKRTHKQIRLQFIKIDSRWSFFHCDSRPHGEPGRRSALNKRPGDRRRPLQGFTP
ncbi:hypothetical protein Mapa_006169 [Marchantia paleacea]|nr:hypothetical protein Mapa_006169 [Marchantia paleacea]